MSLRFLLGVLAPALPSQNNQSSDEEINASESEGMRTFDDIKVDFQTPAKFHIGMLSMSLIIGLAFGGFLAYNCWMEKNIFLSYIRNLVIALTCRTFFSIIFDGAILLGTPFNVGGGNALLVFEQICMNLVLAFWLSLTLYIHARVQRNFNSEPTLRLYQYGVPGVATFFAFVWIFTLQDQWPSLVWWRYINPMTQWIVNSINILFLLIQLILVVDIGRMIIKKTSLDNDSISLLRKAAIMMGVLVLLFWLQFGFVIGRVPLKNSSSYIYFLYFIDGLECALVCLTLYFFNKWVLTLLNKLSHMMIGLEEPSTRTPKPKEILLTGSDVPGIVTIDSVFMTNESKRLKNLEKEGAKDVVYSNIVGPERLKKTLELYKRLNIIPTNPATVIDGEEFYDCPFLNTADDAEKIKLSPKQMQSLVTDVSKKRAKSEETKFKSDKVCEQTQKKNAFYSSKYLILDSKESDIPKYLETCPSSLSTSGRESLEEKRINKNFSSTMSSLNLSLSDELKWLKDNSRNVQEKNNQKKISIPMNPDPKISELSVQETNVNTFDQNEDQNSVLPVIVSTITSVIPEAILRSSKKKKKSSSEEKHLILNETKEKEKNTSDDLLKFTNSELQLQKKKMLNEETSMYPDTANSKNTDEILLHEFKTNEVLKPKHDIKCMADLSVPQILSSDLIVSTGTEEEKIKPTSMNEEVSDAKNSLKKPLNHYLTYSDLLEFRSQQAKMNITQSSKATNNYFNWSQAISSMIGSLINVSGDKNSSTKAETQETEHEENATTVNMKVLQDKTAVLQTQVKPETKRLKVENNQTIEVNGEKGGYEKFGFEELKLSKTNTTAEPVTKKGVYMPTDVESEAPSDSNFGFEVPKEDMYVLTEQTSQHSKRVSSNPSTQEQDKSSTNKPWETNYFKSLSSSTSKSATDQPTQIVIEKNNCMQESRRNDANQLFFENENKHSCTDMRNEEESFINTNSTAVLIVPEKQTLTETSSESEFSIEKNASSSSSDISDSFSLEKYYTKLKDTSTKFSDQPNPLKKHLRSHNWS